MDYDIPLVGGPFSGRMVRCQGPAIVVLMPTRVLPESIFPNIDKSSANILETTMYHLRTVNIKVGRHTQVSATAYVYDTMPQEDLERSVLGMALASCVSIAFHKESQ